MTEVIKAFQPIHRWNINLGENNVLYLEVFEKTIDKSALKIGDTKIESGKISVFDIDGEWQNGANDGHLLNGIIFKCLDDLGLSEGIVRIMNSHPDFNEFKYKVEHYGLQ